MEKFMSVMSFADLLNLVSLALEEGFKDDDLFAVISEDSSELCVEIINKDDFDDNIYIPLNIDYYGGSKSE